MLEVDRERRYFRCVSNELELAFFAAVEYIVQWLKKRRIASDHRNSFALPSGGDGDQGKQVDFCFHFLWFEPLFGADLFFDDHFQGELFAQKCPKCFRIHIRVQNGGPKMSHWQER